jgi:thiol-disulfide isomerase/thioredoxin
MFKKKFIILIIFFFSQTEPAYSKNLRTGPWRFELKAQYGTIPFIINISNNKKKLTAILENGEEKIPLDINFSENGISIPIKTFEISIELSYPKNGKMYGHLVRHNKSPNSKIPIIATFGNSLRFSETGETNPIDLNGKWSVTLTHDNNVIEQGVVLIRQNKNKINGSILTPTGDYRYMEGVVIGNKFKAASFDGVYNYLFMGEIKDGKLQADILNSYKTHLEGQKNDQATLQDSYAQTSVNAINFEFPDLFGNKINLKDDKFRNKPVIIQIFGSWCPNCLDEMNYLIPWYNQNKDKKIEIIALAFERSIHHKAAKNQLLKTYKKYNIPYTLLIAGSTSEDKPMEKLKGLKNFISFPTTIFLNKKHEVFKVHAGFSGPSTGDFYEKWKEEFNLIVNELVK